MVCEIYCFTSSYPNYFWTEFKNVKRRIFCMLDKDQIQKSPWEKGCCENFDAVWSGRAWPKKIGYMTKYTGCIIDEFDSCLRYSKDLASKLSTSECCIIFGNTKTLCGIAISRDDCLELFAKCFDSVYGDNFKILSPPNLKISKVCTFFSIERNLNEVAIICNPLRGYNEDVDQYIDLSEEAMLTIKDWHFPVKCWNNLEGNPAVVKTGDFFVAN